MITNLICSDCRGVEVTGGEKRVKRRAGLDGKSTTNDEGVYGCVQGGWGIHQTCIQSAGQGNAFALI